MESPLIGLFRLTDSFKAAGISYTVVGSVASSLHGEYRTSADVDVVAALSKEQIAPFLEALGDGFYVDDLAVAKAIDHGRSFNVIDLRGIFKIDVFIASSEFGKQQLKRRELHSVGGREIWVSTAEDTILAKLDWYRRGHEISELRWRDIKGILRTQGTRLDLDYLRLWAARLKILALLERALEEVK